VTGLPREDATLAAALARAGRIYLTTWSRGKAGTVPVWFMARDGHLYFTTLRVSLKARRIAENGRVAVRVGSRDGPGFEGRAEWVDDRPDLEREITGYYKRKHPLLGRLFMARLIAKRLGTKESVLIRITPRGPEERPATSPGR